MQQLLNQMIAFEDGELDDDGVIDLFQALVDNGMAWRLQGTYGRLAAQMLDDGLIRYTYHADEMAEETD